MNSIDVSPELGKKILEDYAAGKAVRLIAAERGVSTGIARRTIKESGKPRPAHIRRSTGGSRSFRETIALEREIVTGLERLLKEVAE